MKDKKETAAAKDETPAAQPATAAARSKAFPIVENLHAPEVYADNSAFFAIKGGNLSITLSSVRFDNSTAPGVPKNVIIGRLVMPIPEARRLADGIYGYLKSQAFVPGDAGAN